MRIAAFRAENSASSWYRCYMWMDALRKLGNDVLFDSEDVKGWDADQIDKVVRDADIVISGRTNQPMFFAALQAGRHLYKYKLVIDTDDLVNELHRHHPSSAVYHGATGITRLTDAQYREADGVTVSTRRLLDYTQPHNPYRTYYIPNCVHPDAWKTVRTRPKEDRHRSDIRIYWGGGGGHYGDLLIVKDALLRLARENSRVKLVFQNFIPDWAMQLPCTQAFYVPFVEFHGYYKLFKWVCADIAIAPLEPNEHNLCKSDVKYLDYAMAGVPGVYQRCEPYESVIDGVTGLLAETGDEWYAALRRLVDDAALRKSIASNASDWVITNRNVLDWVHKYQSILMDVAAAKLRPAPEFAMLSEGASIEAR